MFVHFPRQFCINGSGGRSYGYHYSKFNYFLNVLRFTNKIRCSSTISINGNSGTPTPLFRNKWEAVIGLEIHAQIKSKTKLFSSSSTSFNKPVNTNVSVIDAAFPGTIPQLNARCVELAILTSFALSCNIQRVSSFDRKHYSYPDLPAGYQITQHFAPLAINGKISLSSLLDGLEYDKEIRIKQVQLEQDTGKSLYEIGPDGYPVTLIDLNRAGIGLMEIVTEPDIRSSKESGLLVRKLQSLLRAVGSSDGNMEEGSLRCDANVSVHEPSKPFGTRCEIKNLNSVKFLMSAIDAEIERQVELLEQGIPIMQETRKFDVPGNKTLRLRAKESLMDYRYMPEADLPELILSEEYLSRIYQSLPELPDSTKFRLTRQYGISAFDAGVVLGEEGGVEYFEKITNNRNPKLVVNWITHELFGQLKTRNVKFIDNPVTVEQLGSLVDSVNQNIISGTTGKQVLAFMIDGDTRLANAIIQEKGLQQINDSVELEKICKRIMAKYPDDIQRIKKGQLKVFKWFVGQIMRETKGQANPQLVNETKTDQNLCGIAHLLFGFARWQLIMSALA
ncbi:8561_t:CDS:10 [Ambispora gerdemannii]|uniref:Glutamyl-tRNA(Gln) amidotransferase subunit B, mitochondrial n=1 Tax=Ambispora gerdemannii TaxID=144530 RepID=A0A9N8VY66_9GLOM|nr:8561_t:CDS:10 [Ambispora gerdemannii]